jgi:hypothetical protein
VPAAELGLLCLRLGVDTGQGARRERVWVARLTPAVRLKPPLWGWVRGNTTYSEVIDRAAIEGETERSSSSRHDGDINSDHHEQQWRPRLLEDAVADGGGSEEALAMADNGPQARRGGRAGGAAAEESGRQQGQPGQGSDDDDSGSGFADIDDGSSVASSVGWQSRTTMDSVMSASATEIMQYARHVLHLDPIFDAKLLWIAEEALQAKLPKGWLEHRVENSDTVFFEEVSTGHTTWEHPLDEMYKAKAAEEKRKLKPQDTTLPGEAAAHRPDGSSSTHEGNTAAELPESECEPMSQQQDWSHETLEETIARRRQEEAAGVGGVVGHDRRAQPSVVVQAGDAQPLPTAVARPDHRAPPPPDYSQESLEETMARRRQEEQEEARQRSH